MLGSPLRRQSALAAVIVGLTLLVTGAGHRPVVTAAGLLVLAAVGARIVWPAIRAAEQALATEMAAQRLLVEQRDELWAQHQLVVEQSEALQIQRALLYEQQEQLAQAAQELEAQNFTLIDQRDRLERQAEALTAAEEFAGSVIDSASDGIVAFDAARRFTAWNAAMVTLYGRPAADVLGRTLDEVFPELVLEGLGAAWDAALAGTTHMVTNRHVRNTQSGAIVLVDATYGPRRSRDGALAVGGIGVLRDVTAARRQAAELERLSTVVQQTDDGVMVTDAGGCLTWVNAAWERMTGWTLAEVAGRRSGSFLQGVDTDPAAAAALRDAIRAGVGHATELVNYRRDGRPFWSAVTVTPIRDDAGTLSGWVGIKRDVSARRTAERERQQLAAAMDLTPDGISLSTSDGTFEYVNPAQAALFGYASTDAMQGVPWTALHVPELLPAVNAELELALSAHGHWSGEMTGQRPDGTTFPVECSVRRLPFGGAVAVTRDVTARKQQEELLRTWSLRDALTGLHNRRGFTAAAEALLRDALATGAPGLLLYGDLNDFKAINDTFGHDAGDEALGDVAVALRDTLGPTALLARLGGDEFTALIAGAGVHEAGVLAARLAEALTARNARPDSRAPLSLSLGAVPWQRWIREHPEDAPDTLLRQLLVAADRALYAAKARQRAARRAVRSAAGGLRHGASGPLSPLWLELAHEDELLAPHAAQLLQA